MTADDAPQKTNILVVDDDAELRDLVFIHLSQHGFDVTKADGAPEMRDALERKPIDVVILDVMMPEEDGLSIARSLAGRSDLAIIMISALGSETDRIVGLEVGADDYLSKPVSPRELVARIRAVLRRRDLAGYSDMRGTNFVFDGWRCDVARAILYDPEDVIVALSQGEFSLLRCFLERPKRILTRDQLIELSRPDGSDSFDRAVDMQVSRLRRKLASRNEQELIQTVRNEGYMFTTKVLRQ